MDARADVQHEISFNRPKMYLAKSILALKLSVAHHRCYFDFFWCVPPDSGGVDPLWCWPCAISPPPKYISSWLVRGTQKTWSGLSPMGNPVHFRLWGLSFCVLGDVPNWDSGQTQSLSSIWLCSDQKSEFSETESPDRDPRESQICRGHIRYSAMGSKMPG